MLAAQSATSAVGGTPLHTAALILALVLGAVGLVALFGIFFYAQWQVRRVAPAEQRREANRLAGVSLLFWVCAALLVNGAGRKSEGDVLGELMLVIAGLLFIVLVITVARWLRAMLLSLRTRADERELRSPGPGVDRASSRPKRP